jgi:hypothetical protein
MDTFGKKSMLWTDYYKNGQRKAEGHFVEGKENGFWVFWFRNGQKSSEGYFVNGQYDGAWFFWYSGGQKKKEQNWLLDKKEGIWLFWDKSGNCTKTETYHSDELIIPKASVQIKNVLVTEVDSKTVEAIVEASTITPVLEIESKENVKSDRENSDVWGGYNSERSFKSVLRWFNMFNFTVLVIALGFLFSTFLFIIFL